MKNRILLSLSAGLLAIASNAVQAQISERDKQIMASYAEPYGIEKGENITIYIPPTAHITEMLVFFDESNDTINGMFIYYQPNLDTDPVRSNSVGRLEGKLIRVNVDWNDVINGLEVETSPAGALASFLLTTEKGTKRGFQSTLANGNSKQVFGNDFQFAGLTVRADNEKVYAMGLNLVPAQTQSAAPQGKSNIKVFSADNEVPTVASRSSATNSPIETRTNSPKKSGFAQALEDFSNAVAQGKKDREFEVEQERVRKEQQAQRDRVNTNRPTSRPTSVTTSRQSSPRLGGNNKVILYEDCNYRGKAIGIYEGAWDTATLRRFGMDNDKVSSIKILSGYQIVVSSNDYARGGVNKTFDKNIPCLTSQNFNDVLSYAKVQKRPALSFGQKAPSGTKARGPEQLQWTPAGVTGLNVGAVYYDRFDREGKVSQWGRFEITKEGSNIWNWYVMGPRSGVSREEFKKPLSQYRVVGRTKDTITLKGTKPASIHSFIINTRTKKIRGIQEATNGQPRFDFFTGVIKTQSRPR